MTLISKAVDEKGRPIDFSSNKYEKLLKENNGQLDINLLIKNGSPVIPISRPVIRGLNEAMKMYAELLKVYGVPKRVVVETARDLKDHTVVKEQQAFHTDNAKNLYAHLEKQIKENKKYHLTLDVDSWEELKTYEEQNKTKIELYIRQNGRDLLTGEKIILNDLDNIWLYKLTAIMNGRDIWSAKLDMILSIIFFVQFVFGTIGILMLLLMFNNISNSIAMKLDWRKKYIDMLMAIGCTQSICKKIYYGFFWFRNGMAYMAAIGRNSIWLTFMNQIMDKHIGITIENRYTSLNLVIEIGIVGSVIVLGLLLRQWGKVQWTEKIR